MPKVNLLGREVLCGTVEELEAAVLDLQPSRSAFFCNVHMLMLAQEDPLLAQAMNCADLVFPDGAPIAWMQRRHGFAHARVFRGYQAVEALCAAASVAHQPVGFFGSTDAVLDALVKQLEGRFPGLKVDFALAPSQFSTSEIELDSSLVQEINAKNLRYLFVGLGCPKQEVWIDTYADSLNCSLLGVGAAFDWLAGTTRKPPGWMERFGLAWLYRLIQSPGKMWHRYLIYNSKFIFQAAKLLLPKRQSAKQSDNHNE